MHFEYPDQQNAIQRAALVFTRDGYMPTEAVVDQPERAFLLSGALPCSTTLAGAQRDRSSISPRLPSFMGSAVLQRHAA
jgi:hypothetical protein